MGELDRDQSEALRGFVEDLAAVLSAEEVSAEYFERSMYGLPAAYRVALVTRRWEVFVGLLTEALDGITAACETPAFARLHAIVRENVDLLPWAMAQL